MRRGPSRCKRTQVASTHSQVTQSKPRLLGRTKNTIRECFPTFIKSDFPTKWVWRYLQQTVSNRAFHPKKEPHKKGTIFKKEPNKFATSFHSKRNLYGRKNDKIKGNTQKGSIQKVNLSLPIHGGVDISTARSCCGISNMKTSTFCL